MISFGSSNCETQVVSKNIIIGVNIQIIIIKVIIIEKSLEFKKIKNLNNI